MFMQLTMFARQGGSPAKAEIVTQNITQVSQFTKPTQGGLNRMSEKEATDILITTQGRQVWYRVMLPYDKFKELIGKAGLIIAAPEIKPPPKLKKPKTV